jgi:hypothetical protein
MFGDLGQLGPIVRDSNQADEKDEWIWNTVDFYSFKEVLFQEAKESLIPSFETRIDKRQIDKRKLVFNGTSIRHLKCWKTGTRPVHRLRT